MRLRRLVPRKSNHPDRSSAHDFAHARECAVRLLAARPYARAELVQRLAQKGIAPDLAEQAAGWLAARGWLDDASYAAGLVEHRRLHRGKWAIRQELLQRGVERSVVDQSLAEGLPPAAEAEAALAQARRLSGRYLGKPLPMETADSARSPGDAPSGADERRGWALLAAALARRGFDREAIRTALRRLAEERKAPDGWEDGFLWD